MKAFIAKYSGFTHTLAGFWLLLVAAYGNPMSSAFRDVVNGDAVGLYHSLPANWAKIVSSLIALIVPLWGFYRNGQKGTQISAQVLPGESGAAKASATAGIVPSIIVALLCGSLIMTTSGCTQAQKISVAQEIVNWTPALTSAIDTAGGVVATLDPITAPVVNTLVAGVDALSPQFVMAAKNYLANPNQTTLQVIQALVVQIQNSVNTSLVLLQAAHVNNPQSQQVAINAVNGIGTIINALLGLIQSVSSKVQVAAMSSGVTVHLATVRSLLDERGLQVAAAQVNSDLRLGQAVSVDGFFAYEARAGF